MESELQLFESHRSEWLKDHEGQFVLIKEADFSFHNTDEDAYQTAVNQYGRTDVFIKQILPEDMVEDSLSLLYGLLHVST